MRLDPPASRARSLDAFARFRRAPTHKKIASRVEAACSARAQSLLVEWSGVAARPRGSRLEDRASCRHKASPAAERRKAVCEFRSKFNVSLCLVGNGRGYQHQQSGFAPTPVVLWASSLTTRGLNVRANSRTDNSAGGNPVASRLDLFCSSSLRAHNTAFKFMSRAVYRDFFEFFFRLLLLDRSFMPQSSRAPHFSRIASPILVSRA